MKNLPDVQQTTSGFPQLSIEKVGVRGISLPLQIEADVTVVMGVVEASSYCNLEAHVKGINMSRIARTLFQEVDQQRVTVAKLHSLTRALREAHQSSDVYLKLQGTALVEDRTPHTDLVSYEPLEITLEERIVEDKHFTYLTLETVQMSLCPCSKEMSLLKNNLSSEQTAELQSLSPALFDKILKAGFGAHNQKSSIRVTIELDDSYKVFPIAMLLNVIKASASAPTSSVLKRPDEKWVTEVSYMGGFYNEEGAYVEVGGGPRFVEDIAREVAVQLTNFTHIKDWVVVVNNQESIHSGDIVATAVKSAGKYLR